MELGFGLNVATYSTVRFINHEFFDAFKAVSMSTLKQSWLDHQFEANWTLVHRFVDDLLEQLLLNFENAFRGLKDVRM